MGSEARWRTATESRDSGIKRESAESLEENGGGPRGLAATSRRKGRRRESTALEPLNLPAPSRDSNGNKKKTEYW
ncbi:hypothetical protein LINPERPRIM_LOCUS411, partial [Linum perenne]